MGRDPLFASATAGESDAEVMAADHSLTIADVDDGTTVEEAAFARDDDIEFHELIANAEGIDYDNCAILHSESMIGNAERVRIFLRKYADKKILARLDSNKETALHVAADFGNTEVVKVLIEAAGRLFASSANDNPDNQITCFEDFIRHPNDSLNTALHLAVSNGDMATAKWLVEADRDDRHIQNSKGETPIYLAAKLGYEEIVKMICEACTAPGLAGPDATTALHAAIMMLTEGRDEGLSVVKAIIDGAKKAASSTNRSYSSVKSFLRQCNKKDKDTALHLAVQRNHLGVAKYLLEVDPSLLIINKQSDFKSTIYKAAEQGYRGMVALLCDKYEDQNNHVHKGQTALCAAIIGRDKESVISILRRANHPVNYVDDIGRTPLHYAAFYKYDSVLEMIVNAQGSVESEVGYKKKIPTPLCVAAKEGHVSTLSIKRAIDSMQNTLPFIWRKRSSTSESLMPLGLTESSSTSLVPVTKRSRKNVKFDVVKKQSMRETSKWAKERDSSQIVITALITTIAFTVGFTMPGGLYQSGDPGQGLAVSSQKMAFKIFMISDTVTLVVKIKPCEAFSSTDMQAMKREVPNIAQKGTRQTHT
ncbi:hypothetical protein AgCh_035097 [Apium graveolens]